MAAVLNVEHRDGDRALIKITFLDESGLGIERVRVISSRHEVLFEETPHDPECPETFEARFQIDVPEHPSELFPIFADSAPCGTEVSEDEQETYPDREGFGQEELFAPIPVERADNPCFPEFGTMETEESRRQRQLIDTLVGNARAIAEEIEELCAEFDALRRELSHHTSLRDLYLGLAIVTFLVGIGLAAALPWPASLIGFAFLVAAMVFVGFYAHHRARAETIQRELDRMRRSIEDAQDRYRQAVINATHSSCGAVIGLSVQPPTCDWL